MKQIFIIKNDNFKVIGTIYEKEVHQKACIEGFASLQEAKEYIAKHGYIAENQHYTSDEMIKLYNIKNKKQVCPITL